MGREMMSSRVAWATQKVQVHTEQNEEVGAAGRVSELGVAGYFWVQGILGAGNRPGKVVCRLAKWN